MKYLLFSAVIISMWSLASCAQSDTSKRTNHPEKKVGGSCEGCEVIYNSPIPFERLNWIDTLPDFKEQGPKLVVSGTVYNSNGKPARNVVIYVYHTDQTGHYTNKFNEKGWGGRNGYIKGWMRTNDKGQYKFYTLRPAPYPGANIPAHIHSIIKEPGMSEYYIDEFLFDDDRFLTTEERSKQEGRGGNGIMKLEKRGSILYGERNIYLGKNIPDYSSTTSAMLKENLALNNITLLLIRCIFA